MPRIWPTLRALAISVMLLGGMAHGVADDALPEKWNRPLQAARKPFRKIFGSVGDTFAITQRWALFPTARRERHLMWIEARRSDADEWRILYRPHDRAHTYLGPAIEYRRLRGSWNPSTLRAAGGYPYFVTWLARTIFAREADLSEVRVRMEVITIDGPQGRFHHTGRFDHEQYRRRGDSPP